MKTTPAPLGILDSPQVALALKNKDGGSSIEAYESRKSHGEMGDCEQSIRSASVDNFGGAGFQLDI